MKPIPFSFSHLNNSRQCGHKFHEVTIAKRFKDDHSANEWGAWAHKQIEEHYRPKVTPEWHANMIPYAPQIESAVAWAGAGPRYVELKMGISTRLEAIGFFDAGVWGRAVIDYVTLDLDTCEAFVIDWKMGKMKPDVRQLKLFALFIFYHFPRVVTVHTSFEWLQHGKNTREMFSRLDVVRLWREFLPELQEFKSMFDREYFPKKPSGLCGWCPVRDCEHWRDRGNA